MTQQHPKGHPSHQREVRERTGPTPRTRRRVFQVYGGRDEATQRPRGAR